MKLALLTLLIALPARAEPTYWARLLEPERARASRLVHEGNAQLSPALALGLLAPAGLPAELAAQRSLAVEGARTRFALAKQLDPTSREARLAYADTLALLEQAAEAVVELTQLRALDPLYEAEQVAFQLGLLHARAGRLDTARAEYERALALHCDERPQATVLIGLAEVVMFQGDLQRALALYERAAREAEASARVLALWGGAVALDRLGERRAALELARRALASDRAPFAALQQSGVFFVPAYEREYYEALGHLALAELDSKRDERQLALRAFERYVSAGEGPFSELAREHVQALKP